MILHNDPLLSIYFGDARGALGREYLMNECPQENLWQNECLHRVKKLMKLDSLVLLKQMHGTLGALVSNENLTEALQKHEGDFLITQREHTGLAVYTADCLPIVFYDTYNRAVGICHAGWIGSVSQIALKTIQSMQKDFGTELDHLRIFFGPSAKVCCYEVKEDFVKHLEPFDFYEQVLVRHGDALFFDLPLFNRLQLEELGIKKGAMHFNYNMCTVCNPSFCSHRRDKESTQRQLTIVALK